MNSSFYQSDVMAIWGWGEGTIFNFGHKTEGIWDGGEVEELFMGQRKVEISLATFQSCFRLMHKILPYKIYSYGLNIILFLKLWISEAGQKIELLVPCCKEGKMKTFQKGKGENCIFQRFLLFSISSLYLILARNDAR